MLACITWLKVEGNPELIPSNESSTTMWSASPEFEWDTLATVIVRWSYLEKLVPFKNDTLPFIESATATTLVVFLKSIFIESCTAPPNMLVK